MHKKILKLLEPQDFLSSSDVSFLFVIYESSAESSRVRNPKKVTLFVILKIVFDEKGAVIGQRQEDSHFDSILFDVRRNHFL